MKTTKHQSHVVRRDEDNALEGRVRSRTARTWNGRGNMVCIPAWAVCRGCGRGSIISRRRSTTGMGGHCEFCESFRTCA